MSKAAEPATFEVGIVMAGAVSGGAYTAGVLDFLFEALDAFEAAKERGAPGCPRHRVRIKVMTGTSAGAMCVALGFRALLRRGERPSSLYRAWVQLISAKALLTTGDLKPDEGGKPRKVTSILNSTVLDDVARATLVAPPVDAPLPPYVDEELGLGVCTAQLRGIPYTVSMVGSGSYAMNLHAVEHWFEVSNWRRGTAEEPAAWWASLTQTCIASGAFPFGLSPRLLSLPGAVYAKRTWPGTDLSGPCLVALPPPSWPSDVKEPVASYHVDGGLFDNEPLELARGYLAGGPLERNARDGAKATRALLMIDPFLEAPPSGPLAEPGLLDLFPGLLSAMLENARFKPAELVLANDESVFSRFVIAPRDVTDGTTINYALASGVLGAFGGFLSERFREHDYRLGRRNCQKFLMDCFALPAENPCVAAWDEGAVANHQFQDERGQAFRRLVPLYDEAAAEVPRPAPPTWTTTDGAEVREGLARRADAVVRGVVDQYARRRWVRAVLKAAWWVIRYAARGRAFQLLKGALEERGLDVADGDQTPTRGPASPS